MNYTCRQTQRTSLPSTLARLSDDSASADPSGRRRLVYRVERKLGPGVSSLSVIAVPSQGQSISVKCQSKPCSKEEAVKRTLTFIFVLVFILIIFLFLLLFLVCTIMGTFSFLLFKSRNTLRQKSSILHLDAGCTTSWVLYIPERDQPISPPLRLKPNVMSKHHKVQIARYTPEDGTICMRPLV